MKKTFFIISVLTMLFIASCEKSSVSSGNDPIPSNLTSSTWKRSSGCWTYYLTFSTNGTFSIDGESTVGGSSEANGTYTYKDKKIKLKGVKVTVFSDGDTETDNDYHITLTYSESYLSTTTYKWYKQK